MDIILKAKLNAFTKGDISGSTLSKIYTSVYDDRVSLNIVDENTKLSIYSIKKQFKFNTGDSNIKLIEVIDNISKILYFTVSIDDGIRDYYGLDSLYDNYVCSDSAQSAYIENNKLYLDLTLEENKDYTVTVNMIFE